MRHCRSSASRMAILSLLIVVFAGNVRADDWRRQVDALRPKDASSRGEAVLDNLELRAREALAAIPRSRTARDADRRRGPLRRELELSLGVGRLPWPPALRPRVVGTLRYNRYWIEKVVYESLTGVLAWDLGRVFEALPAGVIDRIRQFIILVPDAGRIFSCTP